MRDLARLITKARQGDAAKGEARLRLPRLKERMDLGLGMTLALLGGSGAAIGAVGAAWLAVTDLFDPPPFAPVEDPRILSDYRDQSSRFVDLLAAGDELLIGRENRGIEVYDTRLRTFSREALPEGFESPLSLIATDCAPPDCDAPKTYALTRDGGLAERSGQSWRRLLGDGAFTGLDGARVQQADVRSWAASKSGRQVLVDAGAKGLGHFTQTDASWRSGPAISDARHGPLALGEAFLIGSPRGLHRIRVTGSVAEWGTTPLPGSEGEILDLAVRDGETAFALRRGSCPVSGEGCLSLLQITPQGDLRMLLSEEESLPELNDTGLLHVALQGNQFVALSQNRLAVYDTDARRWHSLATGSPTIHVATAGGTVIHVAYPDQLVTVEGGRITRTLPLDAPLVQILPGRGNAAHVLNRDGLILETSDKGLSALNHADAGLPEEARFAAAAASGTRFYALGPQGMLVHEIALRRYAFVPASTLAGVPLVDALLLPAAPEKLWLIGRNAGAIWTLDISGEFPQLTAQTKPVATLDAAVNSAGAEGSGLVVTQADGIAVSVSQSGEITPLIGAPPSGPVAPTSAADMGKVLLLGDATRIWGYDASKRSWLSPIDAPQGGPLRDIAASAAGPLALQENGALHVLKGDGWQPVSGALQPAAFPLSALQDAMAGSDALYLASEGKVQRYRPSARGFEQTWSKTGSNARLLGLSGDRPIWTNSAGLYLGEDSLETGGSFIDGFFSAEGPVALARDDQGRHYLVGDANCLFMGVSPPRGTPREVAQIGPERLLVVTTEGAGIYEPTLRRWLRADVPGMSAESRLLVRDGHLLRLDSQGLASVPLSQIPSAESCTAPQIRIEWSVSAEGVQASEVDGTAEALLLEGDGTLRRWSSGSLSLAQSSAENGPEMSQVLNVRARNETVEMATPDALWRYEPKLARWSSRPFAGVSIKITTLSFGEQAGDDGISAWDDEGSLWIARTSAGAGEITFERATRPPKPMLPGDPSELRDMAEAGGKTYLLTESRLLVHDGDAPLPSLHLRLPPAIAPRSLSIDGLGNILLTEGPADTPQRIHVVDPSVKGQHELNAIGHSFDPDGDHAWQLAIVEGRLALLRITSDLRSLVCSLPAAPDSTCREIAPAPLALGATDILAYEPGSRLLVTRDAARLLDENLRPRKLLDRITPRADARVFTQGKRVYLWEGKGGRVWEAPTFLTTSTVEKEVARDVDAILQLGTELYSLSRGAVRPLGRSDAGEAPRGAKLWTTEGWAGVTPDGKAFGRNGNMTADPLLGLGQAEDIALPLGPERITTEGTRWLVRSGATLELVWVDLCLPPIDPAFIGPMPEPVADPCAQSLHLDANLTPEEILISAKLDATGLVRIATDGRDLSFDPQTGALIAQSAAVPVDFAGSQLPAPVATVNGRSLLNPPALLSGTIQGIESFTYSPSDFAQPAPYDGGWVRWHREGRKLSFGDGPLLSPQDAFDRGRLLPLSEARGSLAPDGSILWATRSGLWRQSGGQMSQIGPPQSLPLAEGLDAGRFLWADGRSLGPDGQIGRGPLSRVEQAGELEISHDPFGRKVHARLRHLGVDDLGPRGFLHDRRRSVAQLKGDLHYLTPIGLVPAGNPAAAEALPFAATRLEAENGVLLAQDQGGWRQQVGGGWQSSLPPFQNAPLASENGRSWQRVQGAVEITTSEAWRLERDGLDFAADRLLGFAADGERAIAVTPAGTTEVRAPGGLARMARPSSLQQPALPLSQWRPAPGQSAIHDRTGRIWDAQQKSWRASQPQEQPWRYRLAAESDGLSLRFSPTPRASLAAVSADGQDVTLDIKWSGGGEMPFDRVRSLHAEHGSGALLLGTELGLRPLRPSGDGFAHAPLILPPGERKEAGVSALGRPETAPASIQIRFEGGACLELDRPDATPRACAAPQTLDRRRIAETPLLRLSQSAAGVHWRYLVDGAERPLAWPLRQRLPQDELRDRMSCAGLTVELWRDGETLRIGQALHTLPGLQALHCQTAPSRIGGGETLAPGAYALGARGAYQLASGGPTAVSSAAALALADRVASRVVAETGNLRYGLADRRPVADVLKLSGDWAATPWEGGRLVLDTPIGLARQSELQALTKAGLIPAPNGHLDPASLVVMTGPTPASIASCVPHRIERQDGSIHGLAAVPGAPLRLYCRDGGWLEGDTSQTRDDGVFAAVPTEATHRILVDARDWKVVQELDPRGESAGTALSLKGEDTRLSAGRFDFDDHRGLAAPSRGMLEMLSASGWWRSPEKDLGTTGLARPEAALDHRQVSALSADRSLRDGRPGLCVTLGPAAYVWDPVSGLETTGACREDRGQDPLWHWWSEAEGPRAVATAQNGPSLSRRLVDGRFEDLILTGAPMQTPEGAIVAPGRLGVLRWPRLDGPPDAIYATAGAGVLTRSRAGEPVWLGKGPTLALAGEGRAVQPEDLRCPAAANLAPLLGEAESLLRLTRQSPTHLEALTGGPGGRRQLLIDCADAGASQAWRVIQSVSDTPRNLSLGAGRLENLGLSLVAGRLVAEGGRRRAEAPALDETEVTGLVSLDQDAAFAIDARQLYRIDLAAVLSAMEPAAATVAPAVPPAAVSPETAGEKAAPRVEDTAPPKGATSKPAPAEAPSARQVAAPPPTAKAEPAESVPAAPAALPSASSAREEAKYAGAKVQRALAKATGAAITVDGVIGPATRRVIAQWQVSIGSPGTGFLSQAQVDLLSGEAP